jgi:hypothetical protein
MLASAKRVTGDAVRVGVRGLDGWVEGAESSSAEVEETALGMRNEISGRGAAATDRRVVCRGYAGNLAEGEGK